MRSHLPVLLALVALPLSGCMGGGEEGTGTFTLDVTDAPDNIGDFAFLNVTVESITLNAKDGAARNLAPSSATFDLTKLTNGNTTTLFSDEVPVGNYTRLDLHFRNATGTLHDGTLVDVKAPSGRIFLNTAFEIAEGQETTFLFDVQVHKTGNGEYQFKPNADGSGPGKKASGDASSKKA